MPTRRIRITCRKSLLAHALGRQGSARIFGMTIENRPRAIAVPYCASDLLTLDPLPPEQLRLPYDRLLPLRFVVERHRVERQGCVWLHTDFRIEAFGRLLSWASDVRPSLHPDRPIALIERPDHQLKHIGGERRIPEGPYGSGPMVVWDLGWYRPLAAGDRSPGRAVVEALREGRLNFWIEGRRLRGGFRLELHRGAWRLAKIADAHASAAPIEWDDLSILTGRSLDAVAEAAESRKRTTLPADPLFDL